MRSKLSTIIFALSTVGLFGVAACFVAPQSAVAGVKIDVARPSGFSRVAAMSSIVPVYASVVAGAVGPQSVSDVRVLSSVVDRADVNAVPVRTGVVQIYAVSRVIMVKTVPGVSSEVGAVGDGYVAMNDLRRVSNSSKATASVGAGVCVRHDPTIVGVVVGDDEAVAGFP